VRAFFAPRLVMPVLGMATAAAVAVVVSSGSGDPARKLETADQLFYAQHSELLEDFDVAGLEDPADVEIVEHLDELMKEGER
jgi:hypothetical protein